MAMPWHGFWQPFDCGLGRIDEQDHVEESHQDATHQRRTKKWPVTPSVEGHNGGNAVRDPHARTRKPDGSRLHQHNGLTTRVCVKFECSRRRCGGQVRLCMLTSKVFTC